MSRVTVTNPYDLLTDENEERTNVPAPKKEQKPAAPAAKPAPKTAAKPAATSVAKSAAAKPAAKTAAPKAEGAKGMSFLHFFNNKNFLVLTSPSSSLIVR